MTIVYFCSVCGSTTNLDEQWKLWGWMPGSLVDTIMKRAAARYDRFLMCFGCQIDIPTILLPQTDEAARAKAADRLVNRIAPL